MPNFPLNIPVVSAVRSAVGRAGKGALAQTRPDELAATVMQAADRCCAGKIVSVLEGGYNLDALSASAEAHLRALAT